MKEVKKNMKYEICGNVFNKEDKKEKIDFERYWQLCGKWYEKHNITAEQFNKFRFLNGLNKGDIIIVKGTEKYNVGDIIIFQDRQPTPIIHRIIVSDENGKIETKGDHNSAQLTYANSNGRVNEIDISNEQVMGKAVFRIPKLGWVKLGFVEFWRKLLR